MHSLRLLQHILPIVLVELGRVPWPGSPHAIVPLDRRLARSTDGAAQGPAQQQHELVPLPHHPELLTDVPQGLEPGAGHCADQEEYGVYLRSFIASLWFMLLVLVPGLRNGFHAHSVARRPLFVGSCM